MLTEIIISKRRGKKYRNNGTEFHALLLKISQSIKITQVNEINIGKLTTYFYLNLLYSSSLMKQHHLVLAAKDI